MSIKEGHLPILVDKYNGALGIVTGFFSIKLFSLDTSEKVLDRYQLKIKERYDETRILYVSPLKESIELAQLLSKLEKDPLIERVQLELLSNIPSPN